MHSCAQRLEVVHVININIKSQQMVEQTVKKWSANEGSHQKNIEDMTLDELDELEDEEDERVLQNYRCGCVWVGVDVCGWVWMCVGGCGCVWMCGCGCVCGCVGGYVCGWVWMCGCGAASLCPSSRRWDTLRSTHMSHIINNGCSNRCSPYGLHSILFIAPLLWSPCVCVCD